MPEINHTQTQKANPDVVKDVAKAIVGAGGTASGLEDAIARVLDERKAAAVEAAKPKAPDWSKITEQEAMNPAVYIPIIDHEVPDYMNIRLKDTEYEPVWASKDQRRLGQLLAEGYEFIKPEMLAVGFQAPLKFDSDGLYVYADVVAMRVHKSIIFSKRRKAFDISRTQLTNKAKLPQQRIENTMELSSDFPELDAGMSVYSSSKVSN